LRVREDLRKVIEDALAAEGPRRAIIVATNHDRLQDIQSWGRFLVLDDGDYRLRAREKFSDHCLGVVLVRGIRRDAEEGAIRKVPYGVLVIEDVSEVELRSIITGKKEKECVGESPAPPFSSPPQGRVKPPRRNSGVKIQIDEPRRIFASYRDRLR